MDTHTEPFPDNQRDLSDPIDRLDAEMEARHYDLANPQDGVYMWPDWPKPPILEDTLFESFFDYCSVALYAAGCFWRCASSAIWEPVLEPAITDKLLDALRRVPESGLAPNPRGVAALADLLRLRLDLLPAGRWDNPGSRLPLRNGLLEPTTGVLTPYRRSHFIATTLPYAYDAAATAPAWQRFLQTTVPAAEPFLQEFAGYCLTADVHHELSLWLYGPPASGKSTLLHGLQVLLGHRAAELSLDDLGRRRVDPAALAGKTLLVSHEPPADPTALRPVSALVSGEALTLVPPHGLPATLRVQAKLALAFSTLPLLDARFASLYRRAAVVAFPPIPLGAHDPALKDRLSQEGPGLLNWALAGLRRLHARGRFAPPSTMLAAAERLRLTHAGPAAFIAECCETLPDARAQAQPLHRAYVAWCQSNGLEPISARALASEWERLGFERVRIHGLSYWNGLALSAAAPVASLSTTTAPALPTA